MLKGRRNKRSHKPATSRDVDDLDAALSAGDGVKSSKKGGQQQAPKPGKKSEKKGKKEEKSDHKLLPITRKAIRKIHQHKVKTDRHNQHEMLVEAVSEGDDDEDQQDNKKKAVFYGLLAGMGVISLVALMISIFS